MAASVFVIARLGVPGGRLSASGQRRSSGLTGLGPLLAGRGSGSRPPTSGWPRRATGRAPSSSGRGAPTPAPRCGPGFQPAPAAAGRGRGAFPSGDAGRRRRRSARGRAQSPTGPASRAARRAGRMRTFTAFPGRGRRSVGTTRDAAELALAHVVGGAVERRYSRSDLFEQRRVLMDRWAAFVTDSVAPGSGLFEAPLVVSSSGAGGWAERASCPRGWCGLPVGVDSPGDTRAATWPDRAR